VIEATPAERVVPLQVVTDRTMIAAPGVPLGLEPAVQEMVQGRYVHDVLEIGVTTMLYAVLAKQIELEK
jgi:pyrrolysine biosynthesis protein PylD